ncbi:MAG: hypothetical protein ACRDTU_21990 [Micromonosporaceae bacterium]
MRRYLSPAWLLGHVVALALFVTCLALGWWQVTRAGEGNVSSYAYAVEWPVFAGFVAFVWYREVRRAAVPADQDLQEEPAAAHQADKQAGTARQLATTNEPVTVATSGPAVESGAAAGVGRAADEDDEGLAEYNRMLAWLNADPHRRMADYPG